MLHAIVLGGSAAGLFAARVLAQHAKQATLIERDPLPDADEHRKGTLQPRHANNLRPRMMPFFDTWFPGLSASCGKPARCRSPAKAGSWTAPAA